MPAADIERLRSIRTLPSLIKYLRDELDWPIDSDDTEALYFDYEAEELGLDSKTAVKIKEIKQLRPLESKQPWGIFWVNFEKKRLPMVVLRRVLGNLVVKQRKNANKTDRPNWQLNDLLFISSYGEEEHRTISFAHFAEDPKTDELPILRVLGWDDQNSIMHLDRVANRLHTQFRWPDDSGALEDWRQRWSEAFTDRYQEAIRSAAELIPRLALLARGIRKRVKDTLDAESEHGPMRRLLAAVRGLLIHDMDEDAFADMYAQTVAYGLLSARFSRPAGLTAQNLVQLTSVSNPFLENLLENLFRLNRGKFHFDVDEVGINDVLDLLRRTNIEAIKAAFNDENPAEDPVIRFYEGFLKEYDPKQRIQRGIFFTPRPVVSYIVRSVHELLQTEFSLEDGLASTATWADMLKKFPNLQLPEGVKPDDFFVSILDPATGTGTFLFTCIEVIERTMKDKWCRELGKKSWNDPEILARWREYVPRHLLPRLYGYELMMAPYAIAHLKLALKLGETGYQFREGDRLHIYLTNSLEPLSELADPKLANLFATLAKEAQDVNRIKRHKRFTVVIGNPPYSLISANMKSAHRTLVERYKFIGGERLRERGALQLEKILNDDYVKFIAKSQDFLTAAGTGIVGLITNHAYLDNPTMRGLRHSFLASFKQGFFYDLGGSAKKVGENADENVFDIQQGVAICITVKKDLNSEPTNRHARLGGARETKYKVLAESSVKDTTWSELSPSPPYYLFVPTDYGLRSEYEHFIALSEIFPPHSIGCFTSKDHFVISRDPQQLVANVKAFRDSKLPDKGLCKSFEINPKEAWDVSRSREQIRQLSDGDIAKCVLRFTHRPFDSKYIFFHRSLVWSLAYPVNRNLVKSGNLALVTSRQLATPPWNHMFCANAIVEMFLMSNKTKEGNHVFPLYVIPDGDATQRSFGDGGIRPNFYGAFLRQLSSRLLLSQDEMGLPNGLTPEYIFHYAYAVFHSPGYRSRYTEFLKIDFPRLPLTSSLELFRALARLGGELVALHLLESPKLDKPVTKFVGNPKQEIEKVSYSDETVWLDKAQTTGFAGVAPSVWEFHIGAYQVCEKWLKDRGGRKLSKEDITHYHRIVVALNENIRLMSEIDEVIEKYGGWPGAFASTSYKESRESEMPLAAEAGDVYRKKRAEDNRENHH